MATLVLSAVGTFIGGPIGRAAGAIIGSQIDQHIFKPAGREGPRLKELAVTTSSYGTPIPRHFGTMRAAGSIIWATDLVESREKTGGGKGRPSTIEYSYSSSFAVAVASRPISAIGRIWADGNLLRGAAGDMKVAGQLRIYRGHRDQQPDPLIASAEGADCPAFRGLAYCVFEGLQLAEFGNRIPALTFEIIAENGTVQLADVLSPHEGALAIARPLAGLAGFTDEGGPLAESVASIARVYPLACDTSGEALSLFASDAETAPAVTLPEAVIDPDEDSFGGQAGRSSQHNTGNRNVPTGIRYYDIEREHQAGMQRAGGRARGGRDVILEFPGALSASTARALAEQAAERESWAQDRLNWRIAEIDPALTPGTVVRVPDRPGRWRIESWEWRTHGVELELLRQPNARRAAAASDPGRNLASVDFAATPTLLRAFELPWDGTGASDIQQTFAAPSSTSAGWTGAMLYVDRAGGLVPLVGSGNRRSLIGQTVNALTAGSANLVDRSCIIDVQLITADLALVSRPLEDLAQGANRALIGNEIIQFAQAENLGGGLWRLSGLLRGRGGTEHHAALVCPAGTGFVLLDDRPIRLDASEVSDASTIAAIGLVDPVAVDATISGAGATLRPLTPVHPRLIAASDGTLTLCWTRRARGAWSWSGTVEPPLAEQSERYEVGLGSPDQPAVSWEITAPQLVLTAATRTALFTQHGALPLWVRQIGSFARSEPLFLTNLS